MGMIDFKNRLFQFQETHLPERKQILLTLLLILLSCLLLYRGLFRTRWEKEERLEDQIQQFKAELHSPETFGLTWETIEKQRKFLVVPLKRTQNISFIMSLDMELKFIMV